MTLRTTVLTAALLACAVTFWGCEWSGGSDGSYNTSRGAGANFNLSGVYSGLGGSGRAVSSPSGGNITSFTITQTGNRIDVIDNQGSRYEGSVGTPQISSVPTGTAVLPPGWQAAEFQMTFEGKDGVAGLNIRFVGVIDVVTLTEAQGTTTSSSSSSEQTITIEPIDDADQPGGQPGGDGLTSGVPSNVNITTNASSSQNTSTSSSTSFSFSEGGTQYRLRGSWIEEGGRVASVSAASPGNAGSLTVTTGSTATGG